MGFLRKRDDRGNQHQHRPLFGASSSSVLKIIGLVALSTPSRTKTHAASTDCADLPSAYNAYFQQALDDISNQIDTEIVSGLDAVGLAPLTDSLLISDLFDMKAQVFDELFGSQAERQAWLDVSTDIDISGALSANLANVLGDAAVLTLSCVLDNTLERFKLSATVSGSAVIDGSSVTPALSMLPDLFPPLNATIPTMTAAYELTLPLTIDLKRRQFSSGEIKAKFNASLTGSLSQELQILDASTVKFDGTMDLDVAFEYSTISDWLFTGSYSASLTAESTTGTAVANLGIRGGDDDMFDDKPRECCIDVWVLFALPTPHDGLNSYTRT
jgi:hypothetical protein